MYYYLLSCLIFILAIIYLIYKFSNNDVLSIVSATTFTDWNFCKEQFFSMIDYQIIKPNEVFIVISESKKSKVYIEKRNGIRFSFCFRAGKHNQADNRNYGIKRTTSKYVSIIDSDDYISKNAVMIILTYFNKYNNDLLLNANHTRNEFYNHTFNSEKIENYTFPYSSEFISEYFRKRKEIVINCCGFITNTIHQSFLSAKREVLLKNLYNESWKYYRAEDSEIWDRMVIQGYKAKLNSFPIIEYIRNKKCYV